MSRWWRAEDTSIDHPKLLRLSDAMHRAWYTLMCVASANGGELPPVDDISLRLRVKPGQVAAWITHLVTAGLFDNDAGAFRPHNWDKRQYKTDVTDPTNATRQKRYRDKHRNAVTTVTDKRPEAETEQIQSRADTRDDLQKRTGDFRQAIVQAYAESKSPTLPDTSRAQLWLTQGYDPEICLAVIASIVPKKPNVSLSYFDNPIKEAHASKAPKRKPIGGPVPLDWDAILTSYKKFGHWSRDAGNDPTSPGCRAPPDLLRKHGFEPVCTQ